MALVPEWRRRVVGAAGVGVAAPAAVVAAAITVGFGGGGVSGLDSLGQAVTGPVIPDSRALDAGGTREGEPRADLLADTRAARRRARARRPARAAAAPTAAQPQVVAPTTPSNSAPSGSDGREQTSGSGGPSRGSRPSGGTQTQSRPSPAATQPQQTAPPPSASEPTRGPLGRATEPVEDVVEQLPVVGPTTAQVVGGLVDAADGLLNPPAAP